MRCLKSRHLGLCLGRSLPFPVLTLAVRYRSGLKILTPPADSNIFRHQRARVVVYSCAIRLRISGPPLGGGFCGVDANTEFSGGKVVVDE